MYHYSDLVDTPLSTIVNCLVRSFKGYFVRMPEGVDFWQNRFNNSRVDLSLSWGVFDKDNLVGFVIHGIDYLDETLTAYNAGTGVLPNYRGKGLVDKMYKFGRPRLMERGVECCILEVIDQNQRAIKVYKRIGFKEIGKRYCYTGSVTARQKVVLRETTLNEIIKLFDDGHYAWDNTFATLRMAQETYRKYLVHDPEDDALIGYFVVNQQTGYLAQLEARDEFWHHLFSGVSQICPTIKINNIHWNRMGLLRFLDDNGFENTINQFEMRWSV